MHRLFLHVKGKIAAKVFLVEEKNLRNLNLILLSVLKKLQNCNLLYIICREISKSK